jgi:DNA polymerase-4
MNLTHSPALPRTIFHVDMDAFFVSVEELFDPSLKGKAVVVGGQRHERGVVSAASYEARKFGVHSAMPLRTAAKLCPHAVFVDGHPARYRECSEKVYTVLASFSPLVEMASIDEAYLDMTGTERLHGPVLQAAHDLHRKMKAETQLNCSIGIGTSRLVAKVSSAKAKPNGVLWVVPGEEAKALAPLDVRDIPGVGKVTEKNLQALGIHKVGENISANGGWPWPAKRAAKTRVDGSTTQWERIPTPSPSATSTPTTRTPPTSSRWNLH